MGLRMRRDGAASAMASSSLQRALVLAGSFTPDPSPGAGRGVANVLAGRLSQRDVAVADRDQLRLRLLRAYLASEERLQDRVRVSDELLAAGAELGRCGVGAGISVGLADRELLDPVVHQPRPRRHRQPE